MGLSRLVTLVLLVFCSTPTTALRQLSELLITCLQRSARRNLTTKSLTFGRLDASCMKWLLSAMLLIQTQWRDLSSRFWEVAIQQFLLITRKIWKIYLQICWSRIQREDLVCVKFWKRIFCQEEFRSFWRLQLRKMNLLQHSSIGIYKSEIRKKKIKSSVTISQTKEWAKKVTKSKLANLN